jgi:hypothetical protein
MPFSIHASYVWDTLEPEDPPMLLKELSFLELNVLIQMHESKKQDDVRFYFIAKPKLGTFTITHIIAYMSHDLSMLHIKNNQRQELEFDICRAHNIPTDIVKFVSQSDAYSPEDVFKQYYDRIKGITHRSYPLFDVREEQKDKVTQVESYHYEPNILLPPRMAFALNLKNLNKLIQEHKQHCLDNDKDLGKLTLALSVIGTYWCDIKKRNLKNHKP